MKVLNYGRQTINQADVDAVVDVLRSDFLTQGPKVSDLEAAICRLTGAKHCVAVANGTAALHLAVAALELPEGSSGITSANTFLASANALIYNRLQPVFADIDPCTYCVTAESLQERVTADTAVLIPVHFAGQPCDMVEIARLAAEHGLRVIEDAAHAIGSRYADGGHVGNCAHSDMTIFSFHPVKTITTGEGGAITTNSEELCERLRMLRSHGVTKQPGQLSRNPGPWYYEMQALGFNYRMTDILAALGVSQLARLENFVERRREIAARYNVAFESLEWLETPHERPAVYSAFHLYVALIDFGRLGRSRATVMQELREKGVGTQVHYIPVYSQPYYCARSYGHMADACPRTESYYERCLSLPLYPGLEDADVDRVIEAVRGLVG
jgi:perosamine synthetase